jgi:hypothetical protein
MASSTLDASFVLVNREPVPRASLEAILETTLERAHYGGKVVGFRVTRRIAITDLLFHVIAASLKRPKLLCRLLRVFCS